MMVQETEERLKRLREPFDPSVIGKLPRVTCYDCKQNRGSCDKHKKTKCNECGAWVSPAHMHLDYVGHAVVTDRLLEVDPAWNWEPAAIDEHGAPLIQTRGNLVRLWIRLTILGVSRLGVGTCAASKDDAEKELIGDAIRNAAMRFGVALDLWSKTPLEGDEDPPPAKPERPQAAPLTEKEIEDFEASIHFAESMEDLRRVAGELKERGGGGKDRDRLLTAWKLREDEIKKAEAGDDQ